MSAIPPPTAPPGDLRGRRRATPVFTLLALLAIACFLWAVGRFHAPRTGFSSLVDIGADLSPPIAALRGTPHYVYSGVVGYDGAYYVQIAMDPLLRDPALRTAVDNPAYRARRILMPWLAWAAGLGRPALILQCFALLNPACWLLLAFLLWRWLPPTGAGNLLGWLGILFSQGMAMSVHNALTDGPALLLVALLVLGVERRWRGASLALAALGLCKETNLIAGVVFLEPGADTAWRRWGRACLLGAAALVPLFLWYAYILRTLGRAGDAGLNNFTWPLAGLAGRWSSLLGALVREPGNQSILAGAASLVSLTVQLAFFARFRDPKSLWWRLGASYAVLMLFLNTPVWEGFPGAASRVLLPLTLAFNILVPKRRAWLPWLLAGNLSLFGGWKELSAAPSRFLRIEGPREALAAVQEGAPEGWYGTEFSLRHRWEWAGGRALIRLDNDAGHPWSASLGGSLVSAGRRALLIRVNGRAVWSDGAVRGSTRLSEVRFTLPAGESVLEFTSDRPATPGPAGDTRLLAFALHDPVVLLGPEPPPR